MTDILDEILAYTEGFQKRDPQPPQQPPPAKLHPTNLSVQPADLGACTLVNNPVAQYLQPFAPSPRGIQDDFSPFTILAPGSQPYAKSELVPCYPHSSAEQPSATAATAQSDSEAAAAVAAAISTCMQPSAAAAASTVAVSTSSPSNRTNGASCATTATDPVAKTTPTVDVKAANAVPRPHVNITPAPSAAGQAPQHSPHIQFPGQMGAEGVDSTNFQVAHGSWSTGTKRTFESMEANRSLSQAPSSQHTAGASPQGGAEKKSKIETTVVMPPSAKSILERRERAIREGRRKDAKLTEAERRILRRLRNRESAERCRLRRVQQAAQLEQKIQSMQVENDRLVAMAEQYEKTIQRLEDVIAKYKAQEKSTSS